MHTELKESKTHKFPDKMTVIVFHSDPNVPPYSELLYELELLEVQEPIDYSTITESELISHL